VFVVMRQLKDLIAPFHKRREPRKGPLSPERLSQIKNPERIAFFFFLIPAIPNGLVPYVFAETKVSLPRYLVAVVAGTIPATLIFTFLGDRLSAGNYVTAIITAIVLVVIIVTILIFRKKIIARITG